MKAGKVKVEFPTSSEQVLQFASSFGLELEYLQARKA